MKISEIPYSRYDIENVKNAYKTAIKNIKNAACADDVAAARNELVKTLTELKTAESIAFIRWSLNTADEFYISEKKYYEDNYPSVFSISKEYSETLLNCPFRNDLEKIFPPTLFPLYEQSLISENPEISDLCVKESAKSMEYSDFMSSLCVDFNGENIPFTILKKYMQSSDRSERKNAFAALGIKMSENREFLENNYLSLLKIRTEMGEKLGYDNYLGLGYARMDRIAYGVEEVEKLRKNIVEFVVPAVKEMREVVAKDLGITDLKLYDYSAVFNGDDVKPEKEGEDLLKCGLDLYSAMSGETGEFFDFMLKNEAIDFKSRKNKWGGGYQEDIPLYNQPFILANFNGTTDDIDVLTHEAGHAFASYEMSKAGADKEIGLPFMDTAETHSMTMEFLCYKYIDKVVGKDAARYKYKHFIDAFSFLCYGSAVDEFQTRVYKEKPANGKDLNGIWLETEKKYRPFLSTAGMPYFEEGTRWQYQMHIYESPLYYIDYVFAQITALNFLFLSEKDYDAAFEKYNSFISLGANVDYLTALKTVGMPSPLDESAIKTLAHNAIGYFYKLRSDIK